MIQKPFLEIFPKRKSITRKKEKPKEKIIIDYREKNCLVPAGLINLGFDIEFKELKVADYLVKDVAIERKTIEDFISSMINKRLTSQLKDLQQYTNKLLIIEGYETQELYSDDKIKGINANAIRGFLLSIVLKHKIPAIFTKNQKDTASFISVLAKKQNNEMSLNIKKKAFTKKEQLQFIIEGFPGIGPKASKKLLSHFKSIKEIVNSTQEELQKIIGKKAEIFRIVEEDY